MKLADVAPRLLDVQASAEYLGISTQALRTFVDNQFLVPVRLPACWRPKENGRRLLFDLRDLDAFIDRAKAGSTTAPDPGLSAAAVKGWEQSPRVRGNQSRDRRAN